MNPGALLQVAAIGLAALVAGRLFIAAFTADLFRRLDAAGAAASLAVGTAVLTLASVLLSGVGFPTRDLPPLVLALLLFPLWLATRRKRLGALWPLRDPLGWTTLLVPMAVTAWLALLPVTRYGGFSFGNDTYTYCAFSEWLQGHGFSEEARWDPQSPVTGIPALWQSHGYDLGIAHWLALWQATFRPGTVLVVYPAVSAFGLVLLIATLWLAVRQLLRLGRAWAGAVALAFAMVPHALYWGHHDGFLQQGYALPVVVFGLVLLARATSPGRWRAGTAALLALPFAFLFSVYLPLAPLLGFAAAIALIPVLVREQRRGRLGRLALFGATVAACLLLYAARDVTSALSPLHRFATSVAGGHIPWQAADFFRFALGTRVLAPGWVNVEVWPWSPLNRALTPLYGALVLAGLWLAARRPRTQPLAAAAGLTLLAACYFALAVKDPWSGQRGHTWNLFKLGQWAWPFVLLLAAVAVRRLAPRGRRPRLAVLGLALAIPASQVGVHWPWSARFGDAMREMLPGATLAELPALKDRIQNLPPGTLLLVGRPVNAHRWLATAVSLFAYPRAIAGDWEDSASVTNHAAGGEAFYAAMLQHWDAPHVVPILAGFRPFHTAGIEELGSGFALLLTQRDPVLVHVVNPSGLGQDPTSGRPRFRVGQGRTKIVIFSPEGGPADLVLSLEAYPGRPGTSLLAFLAGGDYSRRSVRLATEGSPLAALPLNGETTLRLPLDLPRGLNTVALVVDEGRGSLDARQPVTVAGLSVVRRGGLVASAPGR